MKKLVRTGNYFFNEKVNKILDREGVQDFQQICHLSPIRVETWAGLGNVLYSGLNQHVKDSTGYEIGHFCVHDRIEARNLALNRAAQAGVKFCKETTPEQRLDMIDRYSESMSAK